MIISWGLSLTFPTLSLRVEHKLSSLVYFPSDTVSLFYQGGVGLSLLFKPKHNVSPIFSTSSFAKQFLQF